jgi:hypothetical protein
LRKSHPHRPQGRQLGSHGQVDVRAIAIKVRLGRTLLTFNAVEGIDRRPHHGDNLPLDISGTDDCTARSPRPGTVQASSRRCSHAAARTSYNTPAVGPPAKGSQMSCNQPHNAPHFVRVDQTSGPDRNSKLDRVETSAHVRACSHKLVATNLRGKIRSSQQSNEQREL